MPGNLIVPGMKLEKYLRARTESQNAFARRTGIDVTSINDYVRLGAKPRADRADRIIKASREEPAPDGGTVTLEDLAGST